MQSIWIHIRFTTAILRCPLPCSDNIDTSIQMVVNELTDSIAAISDLLMQIQHTFQINRVYGLFSFQSLSPFQSHYLGHYTRNLVILRLAHVHLAPAPFIAAAATAIATAAEPAAGNAAAAVAQPRARALALALALVLAAAVQVSSAAAVSNPATAPYTSCTRHATPPTFLSPRPLISRLSMPTGRPGAVDKVCAFRLSRRRRR